MPQTEHKYFNHIINIIFFGALWGIFETTVGHLLHIISFAYSWAIMYPVACFLMYSVYKKTNKILSVFFIGTICSSMKLINLLSPIRVDKVINPAISIIFEALATAIIIYGVKQIYCGKSINLITKSIAIVFMNIIWRGFYVIYLLYFVPDWIRNISVISEKDIFIDFAFIQNIASSIVIIVGYCLFISLKKYFENKSIEKVQKHKFKYLNVIQFTCALLLLSLNVILQFVL